MTSKARFNTFYVLLDFALLADTDNTTGLYEQRVKRPRYFLPFEVQPISDLFVLR